MPANVGKVSYENMVLGNKSKDNKDSKNKQKAKSSSSEGMVGKSAGNTKLSPQNDAQSTHASVDQGGDEGVKKQEERQKQVIRKDTSYTDGAIAAAKRTMKPKN